MDDTLLRPLCFWWELVGLIDGVWIGMSGKSVCERRLD